MAADDVVDRSALVQHHLRGVGDHDRHGQHRQDEDHVEERLAAKRLVHQIGEQEAEDEAADRRGGRERQRAHDRPAEPLVGEHVLEQLKPDEVGLPPGAEIDCPLVEREIELQEQHRQQHQHEQRDQRAEDRPAETLDRARARRFAGGGRWRNISESHLLLPPCCDLRNNFGSSPAKAGDPVTTSGGSWNTDDYCTRRGILDAPLSRGMTLVLWQTARPACPSSASPPCSSPTPP